MKDVKLLIGIPAYNEQKTIKQVLRNIPGKISGISRIKILVIDDGSNDQTAKIAENEGVLVARHILNRGLGGALKTIFEFARTNNYDFLITMDADGQHESSNIKTLIDPVLNKKTDIIIGSRWLKKGHAPMSRIFINKIANLITYVFFGVSTSDSQSGLRVFNRKAIEKIDLQTDGMEVSSEFFREIKENKLNWQEVPIKTIYTSYSQAKGQRIGNAPNVFIQLLIRILK